MKNLYVVYRESDGAIKKTNIQIDGKVNELSILKKLKYAKYLEEEAQAWKVEFYEPTILSWQEVEPFTPEEEAEFLANTEYASWWMK